LTTSKKISLEESQLSPAFTRIFYSVLGLTLLSLCISVSLALRFDQPPEHVNRLLEICMNVFVGGVGTILGLLGGKAV
jgi:hypothetical protein